ncbi:hypothetical protein [Fusobacterium varium]|jgi:hypothetical protein|uniref:Uncharacterized protein n=1 Tax=Fusobacterium varium ATCC 27725 TaxID=469618 RepID=A0ABM6U1F9_FUSVA|nr:hypothetical protein [Fusobacterium varium]AVQ30120.1 hypothetical protein C4N18_02325 [Fusobacterium varium ATCC 27725]EES64858.1 hypothetical protein FVAG_01541 [Fusobacterium varium ATCC 27725]VEH37963.1 Uncharacterised protein [Fusobacterium varium]
MIDPCTALELVKTGAGTLSQYIVSDPVTAIANLCTISGFSLRNVMGLFGFKKWGEKFKEKFPNGLETEEQETILSDCFIELEDYIKNSANFDDNVFEKIGALLIHGLENENLLTREYIRILKQLTWIELQIFLELHDVVHIENSPLSPKLPLEDVQILNIIRENLEKKYQYPKELIDNKAQNLIEVKLLKNRIFGKVINEYISKETPSQVTKEGMIINSFSIKEYQIEYKLYSDLGEAIYKLIKKEF